MISSLASIAISAASQYSVSAPSDITPPPISYVTCLQTLQVPSGSHELNATEISINDIADMIIRFIRNIFPKVKIVLLLSGVLFKNVDFKKILGNLMQLFSKTQVIKPE
jgi:hypothetical protein